MRVISGKYKEKKIALIRGLEVRPTMSKVREAVFNIIMHSRFIKKLPKEIHFLDLFTGTGSVSIEALSRGFGSVTAIDIDTRCIRANLEKMDIIEGITVLDRNIAKLDDSVMQYDVVFMDPPYLLKEAVKCCSATIIERTFNGLHEGGWLASDSIVLLEKHKKETFQVNHNAFELLDARKYGMSELSIFAYRGAAISQDCTQQAD